MHGLVFSDAFFPFYFGFGCFCFFMYLCLVIGRNCWKQTNVDIVCANVFPSELFFSIYGFSL